jgi:hypothetical protein
MKREITFASKNSYHIEDLEFEKEPEVGDKIKSEYYPDIVFTIERVDCVPYGIPEYTAIYHGEV